MIIINNDHDLLNYANNLTTYLKQWYPHCVLIPTENNNKNSKSSTSKHPAYSHKDKDSNTLWNIWDKNLSKNGVNAFKKGLLILLKQDLIVIDIDDNDYVKTFEKLFPYVKNIDSLAIQKTSKGKHYFFQRSPKCDELKIFDGARKLYNGNNELPVDIKTVCSTGTGGVISIFPSQNKEWISPLHYSVLMKIPDKILDFIITHQKDKQNTIHSIIPKNIIDSQVYCEAEYYEAKKLVDQLSPNRADNYSEWLDVGLCLHNIHPDLLEVWINFSKKSSKYVDGICDAKWATMKLRTNGLSIASLKYWVKHDLNESTTNTIVKYQKLDTERSSILDDIIDINNHQMPRTWSMIRDDSMMLKLLPCENKTCLVNKILHQDVDLSFISFTKTGASLKCSCCIDVKKISTKHFNQLCKFFSFDNVTSMTKKEEKPSDYEQLTDCLIDIAKKSRLKKLAGYVYKPIENCPCAYEIYTDYDSFISNNLVKHPLMKKNVKRFDELKKYLSKLNDPDFPFISKDRNIISFNNGILLLNERIFKKYDEDNFDMHEHVARNHIPYDFTGSFETPLFHSILTNQFDEDVCKYMYFMIGKLLFKVGEKDNFSIMSFLHGIGRTGKSTIINVVSKIFHSSARSNFAENLEPVFGLQNKWDKEVIITGDITDKFSKVLDQTLFQKMVSGEEINIPQKHGDSVDITWKVPMMLASNHYLDYKDTSQQISRRVVMFKFHNLIVKPDPLLENKIIKTELTNIIWKSLNTYLDIINETIGLDFWDFCPIYFKDLQLEIRQELNYVTKFLTASPEDNCSLTKKYYVLFRQGHVETLADVKSKFFQFMEYKHPNVRREWKSDYTPFKQLGYNIIEKNICKSCKKNANKGCCPNYHSSNRAKKTVVENIELVEEDIE
jgi:hypothetical protein